MNARQIFSSLIAIAGLTFTQLQAQDIVRTNDELLQLVERGTATDDTEFQQRVDRFEQAQAEQDRLTAEANVEKRRQEDLSERLETAFEENELLIADRTEQLNTRLGSLRELFGVLQQVAGDARSLFENSITNIEYPDRAQFLTDLAAKMGSSSELASIAEIERLWFELQREATEQGKVKRISDFRFVTADGQEVFEDIVRVGTFNLVADGRYLSHNPDTNSVSELVRQPSQRRYTRSTADLLGAAPGDEVVRFGLDVTSGQLLALLLETPNLGERVQQGGIVGYVIISLGILGILLALEL
jgi:biopolymer transport protein ExbB